MAPDPTQVLDNIVQQVTSAGSSRDSIQALANYLKNLNPKELRDAALASSLSNGQDPLSMLTLPGNTLGVLYILVARLNASNAQPPPSMEYLERFCREFDPEQARFAPERVTLLAKGIQKLAIYSNNPRSAIPLLHSLTARYPPSPAHLTTLHPLFLLLCLQSSHPSAALPILTASPSGISEIDLAVSSDLTYNDNLVYHYLGGVCFGMLGRWGEAEECWETCVSAPGVVPAALQMEALKKLRVCQLISKGKISPLPKYTNHVLLRLFKNTPYHHFVNAYPHNVEQLRAILVKEQGVFNSEKNMGLMKQAMDRAPRWELKKLTNTYLSLNLADIGRAIKVGREEDVRGLLLDMIEAGDISASIGADGSVTFSDPPARFTKAQVDAVLGSVQEQSALLEYLDREVGRSKEFLSKAVKGRDEGMGGPFGADEDVFAQMGPGGAVWGIDD